MKRIYDALGTSTYVQNLMVFLDDLQLLSISAAGSAISFYISFTINGNAYSKSTSDPKLS